jgi:hypothetical protein
MKHQFKTIFICLLLLTSLPSCMVSKCRYSGGWNLGVNLNSLAKQDQQTSVQKQKPLKKKSIVGAQSTDSINVLDSAKLTRTLANRRSNDSLKQVMVKNILNPQAVYTPVLKSKKSQRGPRIDKGDFINHIQKQTELSDGAETDETDYESPSYEWLIVFVPLVLGLIFLCIPALAVIGTWIIVLYAAIGYAFIDGMFDLDLSWLSFFVQ